MRFQGRNSRAAKLTVQKVKEIRQRYAEGETQSQLSRVYQVSLVQIGRIVRGESWQKVPGAEVGRLEAEESERYFVQRVENGQIKTDKERAEESFARLMALQGKNPDGTEKGRVPPPPPLEELEDLETEGMEVPVLRIEGSEPSA